MFHVMSQSEDVFFDTKKKLSTVLCTKLRFS